MNPANRNIENCGGPKKVASMFSITTVHVHKLTYPWERGGTSGLILARHQQRLFSAAKASGTAFPPGDFFDIANAFLRHAKEGAQSASSDAT
jgi:hypothetical protein